MIYDQYKDYILDKKAQGLNNTEIARQLKSDFKLSQNDEAVRDWVRRTVKHQLIQHPALEQECENVGIPIDSVRSYWHKGKHFSIFVKGKELTFDTIKDELISAVKSHSPKYPKINYQHNEDSYLLVIDPADIHLNKLCSAFETGDESNHDIIYNRVIDGIKGIINKTKGYKFDRVLFVGGNDILHVDNPQNTTTSGTRQDVSMMWYDAFKLARKLIVECIELLLPVAPVMFHYDPSNHDYTQGFFLAQNIEAWFSKCENIEFNISMAHRKYFTYHNNLIGTTHGDGAKEQDLPLLMAHESAESWAKCKHRYYYVHHLHHKRSREYMSVCVETLRSPSGTDSWHHRNGYQHSPKAIEGFIHDKIHGQIARITHIF